ncbi:MAG: hypothetical protein IPM94_12995 [bacterium]|nr:hypothetical protein [bacterium]
MISNTEIQGRLERFQAAAKAAGVKLTHQRLEIFREVAASLEHPDAETVFRTVKTDARRRCRWTPCTGRSGCCTTLGLVATLAPRRERALRRQPRSAPPLRLRALRRRATSPAPSSTRWTSPPP